MYPQTLLACVFVSVSPKLYGSQKVWPAAALLHESNFHEMESCQWRRGSGNAVWQSTDFKQPDRRRYITYMCVCVCVCVPLTLAGVQHQVLVVLGWQRELMFCRVEHIQQEMTLTSTAETWRKCENSHSWPGQRNHIELNKLIKLNKILWNDL